MSHLGIENKALLDVWLCLLAFHIQLSLDVDAHEHTSYQPIKEAEFRHWVQGLSIIQDFSCRWW